MDSTARLKYFHFIQEPIYYTDYAQSHQISFFAKPSQRFLTRSVEIDSTGQSVVIKEKLNGEDLREPLVIPIDEYIKKRLVARKRKLFEDEAYRYTLITEGDGLSSLLSNITNISIPLPSAGFLSIFGPPKISLRINGAVDIHGSWKNEVTEGLTASLLGNTRNTPDFSQKVQVNVSGTIGDKLNISADWNTQNTFEYENRLKIKYTGYDDEIIQSIEAGNVSLQTTPLIGGSEALFGIKAQFQLGPFSLTTIASQKKGEVKEVDVKGGSQSKEFSIHAWDYEENHFFIDQAYADTSSNRNFFYKYYGEPIFQSTPEQRFYQIKQLEVWKTPQGLVDVSKERKGNAYIDLDSIYSTQTYPESLRNIDITPIEGRNEINGRFEQLIEDVDYIYNAYTGFISFKSTINENDVIGVAYRLEGATESPDDDIFYGDFVDQIAADTSKVILLKLIKPKNLQPGGNYADAWNLMLKNIYYLGGMEIKKENFELDIYYDEPGKDASNEINNQKLLEVFGLDKTSGEDGGGNKPDGKFDFFAGKTILPSTGQLIFPVLQPFGKQFPSSLPSELKYQAIYDTVKTFAQQDKEKDRFLINGEFSASISSTFNIGFNVVQNSVRVLLGNRELQEGKDYQVDYNIGQVIIRNDAALVPGADLKITFEQNDLLALASKTLIGARGIYEFNKNTSLGFSFMNMSQESLNDKVRLGEEPISNTIMGADFNTTVELPSITKLLDNVMSTSTPSSVALKGEFAYIDPDPNTRKSTITGDGDQSIAYLDDFEGSKKTIPIGISYTGWKDVAAPDSLMYHGSRTLSQIMNYKGRTLRYNRIPTNVLVQDIWPERTTAREDSRVTVLDVRYQPSKQGQYNFNEDWSGTDSLYKNWGGMGRLLSSTANNLVAEKIEYIEFWAQVVDAPVDAKIYIDLGKISEDIIPNNQLDTEDKDANDRLDEGEDLGIDGQKDIEEPGYDATNNPDPAKDNFALNTSSSVIDYSKINGTQGNAVLTDLGIAPDTEDLNRNFNLDKVNNYFRFEIPLDTNRTTNPYITGGGYNSWYQYKIPLKEFTSKIGSPSFTNIEALRVWFQNADSQIWLRMVEMNLVGNQWEEVVKRDVEDDEVLSVSTVSYEENPEYYLPDGVIRERDRSQTDTEVLKNEQSLSLIVKDLPNGEYREASKYLPQAQKIDIFSYKEMKLFFHGDLNPTNDDLSYTNPDDANDYNTRIYFRFGADTTNFYEYSMPLAEDWQSISIKLNELPALKEVRDMDTAVYRLPVAGRENHFYGVRGNPSLTKISFFLIRVENPRDVGSTFPTSGTIWVNELRVLGADDTPGWAYNASASVKLADFVTVSGNMRRQDPYFHKVTDRFGTREDRSAWGMAVDVNLLKLMPFNTDGSNLSVNYQRTENIVNPLYMPSSDISVDKAVEQIKNSIIDEGGTSEQADAAEQSLRNEVQTLTVSEAITLSNIKIKVPSREWYFENTINALTFNFNYSRSRGRNPTTTKSEMWSWKGAGNYAINLGNEFEYNFAEIPLIGTIFEYFEDYKNASFRFAPNNFKTGFTLNRKYNYSLSRNLGSESKISTDFVTTRQAGFDWTFTKNGLINLGIKYNVNVNSSLNYLLYDDFDRIVDEAQVWNAIFDGEFFGRDNSYQQSFSIDTKPKLPSLWGLSKFFTISAGYGANYSWKNDFNQEELGRSAGYSSNLNTKLSLKWKSLTDPLFPKDSPTDRTSKKSKARNTTEQNNNQNKRGRGRGGDRDLEKESENKNSLQATDSTKTEVKNEEQNNEDEEEKVSSLVKSMYLVLDVIRWSFFDYDQFSFNFSQKNNMGASGLRATGTGFTNFWSTYVEDNGPSRLFMLGLSNDVGARASNGSLSEKFTHSNNFTISTQRPLWEGANVSIDWKVDWGLNKSYTVNTDEYGNVTLSAPNINGSSTRSFLSLPFGLLGGGVASVAENYNSKASDPAANLSDAFLTGMEAIPIFARLPFLQDFAAYIPRPNWRLTWNGIEKFPIIENLVKKASLSHGYSASYIEGWKINADGKNVVQSQKINYSFSPLIGLSLTFDEFFSGNLRGDVKYNLKNNYDLGISTRTITEGVSNDINMQFSFSRSGFSIPLFGLNLKNDLEFSFAFTNGRNATVIYAMDNFNEEGKPQDGSTRSTLEPRVKYVMSSKITLSIFYRRTTIEPEGASRIPPTTTNEAGLDVHISIN